LTAPPKISICIPTFNRHEQLERCLESIKIADHFYPFEPQICILDSSSENKTKEISLRYSQNLNIKYQKNAYNMGYAGNFKKCVSMASSRMVWLIGDDDLLVADCFQRLGQLFSLQPDIKYFYCNAFQLDHKYFERFSKPFDTVNLPSDMKKYTNCSASKLLLFNELIDHKVSFDFLAGMFLSIFDREMWESGESCVNEESSKSPIKFIDLDSTFPHSKIFANTFMNTRAYLMHDPLIVATSGEREWSHLYPIIRTFRLIDLLLEYKKNGLPYRKYLKNKNATVKYFAYDAIYYLRNKNSDFPKIDLKCYVLSALIYPNFYFSFVRKLLSLLKGVTHKKPQVYC
jgi:glycosyltransferase involved in cell wall biosynthesis